MFRHRGRGRADGAITTKTGVKSKAPPYEKGIKDETASTSATARSIVVERVRRDRIPAKSATCLYFT